MTKPQAERLLAQNAGRQLCVAYRTAPDGTLLHRPEPRPPKLAASALMALGLAACAGHAPEIDHPGEGCRDSQGYEVDCEQPGRRAGPMIPNADPDPTVAYRDSGGDLDEPDPGCDLEVDPGTDARPSPVDLDRVETEDDSVVGLVALDPETEFDDRGVVGVVRLSPSTARQLARRERQATRAERRAARRDGR